MYNMNRPAGAAYPYLLGQTRPMSAPPTTYIQPAPPYTPASSYTQSQAGSSITANLKALGASLWATAKDLFARFKQGLAEIK